MKNKEIHIVSFDVPFPTNYGGAIDVFYRLKSLHQMGMKIHLHCFEYGRGTSKELEAVCFKVNYYKRTKHFFSIFSKYPFIVQTRINQELLANLKSDDLPILFEGLHTTWYLKDQEIKKRLTIVRTHNIEHDYYQSLANKSGFIKKVFFYLEAFKLKKYESILKNAKTILSIKESDAEYFRKYCVKTFVLSPSFQKIEKTDIQTSTNEKYVLFHGNLSVKENEKAIVWLIENVYKIDQGINWKIAGKNPSIILKSLLSSKKIELIENPSQMEMNQLIQDAHIHVFYSDQSTGVKLKLISALQTKGFVIANNQMFAGTFLGKYCYQANTAENFQSVLADLCVKTLSDKEIESRNELFDNELNMLTNNGKIIQLIN